MTLVYPTAAAIRRINTLLQLPATGQEQDWEIELADSTRVQEFCQVYQTANLTQEEKFTLMALIIASYDDYLRFGQDKTATDAITTIITKLLVHDFALHKTTINYWCQHEITSDEADWNNPEWVFAVTPLMRRLWKQCEG
jgi:hypothetical protein